MDARPSSPAPDAGHAAQLLDLADPLVEVDSGWRIVAINQPAERLAGVGAQAVLGRTLWEVWPDAARPDSAFWREYHRCMEQRVAVRFEDYYAPLGMWTSVMAHPVSTGGIAVYYRDITAQKRAELALRAEHAFTAAVLDTVANVVIVMDREGRIVRVNEACHRLTGYPASELIGQPVFDVLIPADEMQGVRETFRRVRAGHFPNHHVNRWRMKDGSERTLEWDNTAILDPHGEVEFVIATGADVTDRRRDEQRLRESEARARTVTENVRDLLVLLEAVRDPSGAITGWRYADANEGALELLGARREDVVGRMLADVLPDRGAQVMARLARVTSTGVPDQYEREFGGRTLLIKLFRIGADRAGSAAIDITDRKRAEEALRDSEARHRAFFHSVMELAGVHEVVKDASGTVVDSVVKEVNDPTLAFLGTSRGRVLGRRLSEVVPPEVVRALVAPWTGVLASGVPASYEVEIGGHVLLVSASRMNPATVAAVASDITERKRAESALRERDQALLDADRRKDEFLSMLSHELRNPLAPIRNALYILDHAAPAGEQARRAKEVANRQIAHITRLVDDLLDITRVARGKIELRRSALDLSAVARRTADDYRSVMHDRGLDLVVELPREPVPVAGDETRLAQVFGNLLSNAAKFTPPGGRVTVTVRAEDDRAVVHVRDTGPGIPPDILPTIFEPFTQGKQTLARTDGGLGLGLALVKGLASLHGGDVRVESDGGGRGSDFIVTLPLAARGEDAAARGDAARQDEPASVARRVLVIDDNRDAADTLAQLVAMLGHHPVVAYDAITALARAVDEPPDVVLCDLGLPGMDGYELARQLRAISARRPVRLVAISGYAQPEDVAAAIEAGFDAHVPKPPDPDQLVRLLGAGDRPTGA